MITCLSSNLISKHTVKILREIGRQFDVKKWDNPILFCPAWKMAGRQSKKFLS